jgi:hypothetical protein
MNHRYSGAPKDASNQLSKTFSSHDGCRILSTVLTDESRLLQDTKRILEKRVLIDEQYARNLQDLTASADRVAWPVSTHPIASVIKRLINVFSMNKICFSRDLEKFFFNGHI